MSMVDLHIGIFYTRTYWACKGICCLADKVEIEEARHDRPQAWIPYQEQNVSLLAETKVNLTYVSWHN